MARSSSRRRFLTVSGVLVVTGFLSVTMTFYLVSLQPEGSRLDELDTRFVPVEPFGPRFSRWVGTLVGSGFTDWGGSPTAPDVLGLLRERLHISAVIALASWLIGWCGGLGLAMLLSRSRRGATLHLNFVYPIAQAIPSLTIVFLTYTLMVLLSPTSVEYLGLALGIAILSLLILPAASALWLNAFKRILNQEFVRVARASGMKARRLWIRHLLPNAVVTSGVLTQAAFSLAGLAVGSIFVEKAFSLGGISQPFLEAIGSGQAELAASATIIYFVPLALGVSLAEGLVLWLQPEQGGARHAE